MHPSVFYCTSLISPLPFLLDGSPFPPHVSSPSFIGCTVEGALKSPGDTFYIRNCEQKCICDHGGILVCQPLTCPAGLFPVGAFKENNFCREMADAPFADECCISVECSSNFLQSVHLLSNDHHLASSPLLERPPLLGLDRRVPEISAQTISEQDYPHVYDDYGDLVGGDISLINDQMHFLKAIQDFPMDFASKQKHLTTHLGNNQKQDLGELVFSTKKTPSSTFLLQTNEDKYPPKEITKSLQPIISNNPKENLGEVVFSTEKTPSSTFLLQTNGEKYFPKEITKSPQPIISLTTTPPKILSSATDSMKTLLSTLSHSQMIVPESSLALEQKKVSNFPLELQTLPPTRLNDQVINAPVHEAGMIKEVTSGGEHSHITIESEGATKNLANLKMSDSVDLKPQSMIIQNNETQNLHNVTEEVDKSINIAMAVQFHNDSIKIENMQDSQNHQKFFHNVTQNLEGITGQKTKLNETISLSTNKNPHNIIKMNEENQTLSEDEVKKDDGKGLPSFEITNEETLMTKENTSIEANTTETKQMMLLNDDAKFPSSIDEKEMLKDMGSEGQIFNSMSQKNETMKINIENFNIFRDKEISQESSPDNITKDELLPESKNIEQQFNKEIIEDEGEQRQEIKEPTLTETNLFANETNNKLLNNDTHTNEGIIKLSHDSLDHDRLTYTGTSIEGNEGSQGKIFILNDLPLFFGQLFIRIC